MSIIPNTCHRSIKQWWKNSLRTICLNWPCTFNNKRLVVLTGVAQLVGSSSRNQKAVASILGQGTYPHCRFNPWSRCIWEATNQCFSLTSMFLSLPFSLCLSLKAMKKKSSLGEDLKKKKEKTG